MGLQLTKNNFIYFDLVETNHISWIKKGKKVS